MLYTHPLHAPQPFEYTLEHTRHLGKRVSHDLGPLYTQAAPSAEGTGSEHLPPMDAPSGALRSDGERVGRPPLEPLSGTPAATEVGIDSSAAPDNTADRPPFGRRKPTPARVRAAPTPAAPRITRGRGTIGGRFARQASATGTDPSPHPARRTQERDVPSRTDVALPPARQGWGSRLLLTPHPRAIQRSHRGARTRFSVDEGGRARPVTPPIGDQKRDAPSGGDAEKLSGTKKCRVAAPR